jgi:hypothetical protein
MIAPLTRIILRWIAGMLVAKGFFAPEDGLWLQTDPDVAMLGQMALGFAVGALAEAWYAVARKMRWAT